MLVADRVAVVTGGGRGIGYHAALALARHGAKVMVVDKGTEVGRSAMRDPSVAEAAAKAIVASGGEAIFGDADVTDPGAVDQVMTRTVDAWGKVDVLVNAAGIIRDRVIWNVPEDEWDDVQRVHLKGCYATTRALARMIRRLGNTDRPASIINFTSSAGIFGAPGSSAYGSAKAGVIGFTRVVAMELRKLNVRVNCILPFAWTRMAAELPTRNDGEAERVARLQRLRPEDVANLVVSLAASPHPELTGQVIGLRGKEMMLFAQPRVDLRVILPSTEPTAMCRVIDRCIIPHAAPPMPSTQVFDYDPFVDGP